MRKTVTPTEYVQLTDDQWETIAETLGADLLEALDPMKCSTIDELFDLGCEMVVRSRVEGWRYQLLRLTEHRDNSKYRDVATKDRDIYREVIANIDILNDSLNRLANRQLETTFLRGSSPEVHFEENIWQLLKQLDEFKSELTKFGRGISPKLFPSGVDMIRDQAWEDAVKVYERVTGKRATVTITTSASENEGQVTGKFLNFIQAVMKTVPGEPLPTGNQVHAFLKKFRSANNGELTAQKRKTARH